MKTDKTKPVSHTPGPWVLALNGTAVLSDSSDDPEIVAWCEVPDPMGMDPDQAAANARLIAAAPEMRAMLDEMAHAITQGIIAAAEAAETGPATEVMRQREDRMRRAQDRLSALLAKINGEG